MSISESGVPIETAVWCGRRWIDFEQAVPAMDQDLLDEARFAAEEHDFFMRRADERLFADLASRGGVEAEFSAALQALPDARAQRFRANVFEVYLRLHESRHGKPFDPDVPTVGPPPADGAAARFQQVWESFRTRLPAMRLAGSPGVDR